MSCKRICRELLWSARFGELGVDAQPHLEHLTSCRSCRDEVGFDRAMVEQLRRALAERIADAAPSPQAWATILARASEPEPEPRRIGRLLAWSAALGGRLRVTAIATTGLALLLALNTEIVPMTVPAADEAGWEAFSISTRQIPRLVPVRAPAAEAETVSQSETVATGVTAVLLPPSRDGRDEPAEPASPEPPATDTRIAYPAVDMFETAWFDETDFETEDPPAEPPAADFGEPS